MYIGKRKLHTSLVIVYSLRRTNLGLLIVSVTTEDRFRRKYEIKRNISNVKNEVFLKIYFIFRIENTY